MNSKTPFNDGEAGLRVVRMLEAAGFEDVRGLGSLEGEPFRLGSTRLILVATKKG